MSVASSMIECDKCDYGSSMSVVHGIFNYVSNGSKYNVGRSYGWCYECQEFVAVENLVIDKDIESEIINTQKKIEFVESVGFWARMRSEYKKLKRDFNFNLKHIQELEWKIDHIKNRNSPPRCLVCGATNISSIDVRYLDYYHPGPAKKLMGFTHPNCGGKLWLIRDPIRWNIKFTPQVYDIEGNRISSPK